MAENINPDNKGLDKELPSSNPNQQYKGEEGENHSTAAEGTLKDPDELPADFGSGFKEGEERDLDDLVHEKDQPEDEVDGPVTPLNKEQKFTPDDISS